VDGRGESPVPRCPFSGATKLRIARLICAGFVTIAVSACNPAAPTIWKTDTLAKCQKSIETEGSKLTKKLFGILKKCKDDYRKAILKGDPLTKAAGKCDAKLQKDLLFPDPSGKSALAKTKAKLDKLTDPAKTKCTDTDLLALGHLPTSPFGDLWARLILMQALKFAIEQQVLLVRDTVDIFQQLTGEGCTSCETIANLPCTRSTCVSASPNSYSMDVCWHPGILGADFGVFVSPSRTQIPSPESLDGERACYRIVGGEGYIGGTGSVRPNIKAQSCQDHVDDDGDECPSTLGVGALCASAQPDPEAAHAGTTNSGACFRLSDNGAGGAGTSLILVTGQTWATCNGGACGADTRGADGIACTRDDTASRGATVMIPMTTDVTEALVLDENNVNGASSTAGPDSGTPFVVSDVATGALSGGKWMGWRTVLHSSPGTPATDDIIGYVIECE
jgi:hypothetical protein